MTQKTSRYGDACGTAHTLDLVGDRWALLVARELLLGPRRFSQLQAALTGINPKALSARLVELEASAILVHYKLPPPAAVQVYELTEWGYELEAVTAAMGRWAARSPFREPGLSISGVSLLLSFRAMLDPSRAAGLNFSAGFKFGDDRYNARLSGGQIELACSAHAKEDVVFDGSPNALAEIVYAGRPLEDAKKSGTLNVSGELALAEQFVRLFPLPLTAPRRDSRNTTVDR